MEEEKMEMVQQEKEVAKEKWWRHHAIRDKDMRKWRHYKNKFLCYLDGFSTALFLFLGGFSFGVAVGLIAAFPFFARTSSLISDLFAIYVH